MTEEILCAVKEKDFCMVSATWANLVIKPHRKKKAKTPVEIGSSFYDRGTGNYLGFTGTKAGENIYIADKTGSEDIGNNTVQNSFNNVEKLDMTHTKFRTWASTVFGERTPQSGVSSESAKEMAAIAYVHLWKNKTAFGKDSGSAVLYRNTKLERQTESMKQANWAVINAAVTGFDYSYGATAWDGQEQSFYDESEKNHSVILKTSKGNISIELHMNTRGWNIADEHYANWKRNVGSKFKAPQIRYATVGVNKGKITYYSTAAYEKSIFWREV